jgi:hypothetical protein
MNNTPKLWIAPLSKEIVELSKDLNNHVGYIISENQVNPNGGYTGWTLGTLKYTSDNNIPIWRDHSSCDKILEDDSLKLDGIHLDVIKCNKDNKYGTLEDFVQTTIDTEACIEYCIRRNLKLDFEIGTEEAIFKYETDYLENILADLCDLNYLRYVKFAVIQCGTSLKDGKNIGEYNPSRLADFCALCKTYDVLPKEHNGDFVDNKIIKEKQFISKNQLHINIAPEIGSIQSLSVYDQLNKEDRNLFYMLVKCNHNVAKWLSGNQLEERDIVSIGGHYIFNTVAYKELQSKVDMYTVKRDIQNFLLGKISAIYGPISG